MTRVEIDHAVRVRVDERVRRVAVCQRVEADRRAVGDAFGAAQRRSEAVQIVSERRVA